LHQICSELTRWLAQQAEEEGVDIIEGCAASDVLIDGHGSVTGVVTQDMGIAKDGARKPSYMPGAQVNARATLIAEGCRGSLAEVLEPCLNAFHDWTPPRTFSSSCLLSANSCNL
jgi:electron-transferring-flavoprotein dehydrogenase